LGANIQPSFQTNQFALADKTGYLDLGIGMMGKVMPQPQRVGNVNQFVLHIFSSKYILYILAKICKPQRTGQGNRFFDLAGQIYQGHQTGAHAVLEQETWQKRLFLG
jgi:hypothetical protein